MPSAMRWRTWLARWKLRPGPSVTSQALARRAPLRMRHRARAPSCPPMRRARITSVHGRRSPSTVGRRCWNGGAGLAGSSAACSSGTSLSAGGRRQLRHSRCRTHHRRAPAVRNLSGRCRRRYELEARAPLLATKGCRSRRLARQAYMDSLYYGGRLICQVTPYCARTPVAGGPADLASSLTPHGRAITFGCCAPWQARHHP